MNDYDVSGDVGSLKVFCEQCQQYYLNKSIHDACMEWTQHVKHKLFKGGGTLFSFIAREEKKNI